MKSMFSLSSHLLMITILAVYTLAIQYWVSMLTTLTVGKIVWEKIDSKLIINGVELKVVSPSKIRSVFEKHFSSAIDQDNLWKNHLLRMEHSGPAVTSIKDFDNFGTEVTYIIDIVLAVKNPKWSVSVSTWPDRKRNWPSRDIIKDIVAAGVYLVSKLFNLENQ